MISHRLALGLLAAGAVALLSGCGGSDKSTYRFKMTIEVETPQGLRTGSSVYEVAAWRPVIRDATDRAWSVRGEAVAVDLPGGKTLFALLKTNAKHSDMAGLSMTALDPAFHNDIIESAARIASGQGIQSPAEVAPSDYPLLVVFRDLEDPKSLEQVASEDLATAFGAGVKLKRITVGVTNEDMTVGIEKKLPNFGKATGYLAWQQTLSNDDPRRRLTRNDFISGVVQ